MMSLFVKRTTSRYLGALLRRGMRREVSQEFHDVLLVLCLRDKAFPGIVLQVC
jgi:hypothetical protein